MKDISYTRQKIGEAAAHLISDFGTLRERIPRAHTYLLEAGNHTGYEWAFDPIKQILGTVSNGDYGRIPDRDLHRVALLIYDMSCQAAKECPV